MSTSREGTSFVPGNEKGAKAMKNAAVVLGGILCGNVALAAISLSPGEILFKEHPSVSGAPKYSNEFTTGGAMIDQLVSPIIGDEFLGSVTTQIFAEPGTGFLTFQYRIELDDRNKAPVVRATMGDWSGITILDAGADGSGMSGTFDPAPEWLDGDPLYIARDPFSQGLTFQWREGSPTGLLGTVIGSGDTSSVLFFSTNVTQYVLGEIDLIDTAVTGEAQVFVPIPEPGSLGLILAGAAAALIRRRI
jgi:hypothetical protein